jgi:hypothetical protein
MIRHFIIYHGVNIGMLVSVVGVVYFYILKTDHIFPRAYKTYCMYACSFEGPSNYSLWNKVSLMSVLLNGFASVYICVTF